MWIEEMRLRTLTTLLWVLAGSAALASCAKDATRSNRPGEADDLQRQANSCGEKPASTEEMQKLAELAEEKGFAEKYEQAREQHEDAMLELYEHVTELISKHALPGAEKGDKHGEVTIFPPPAIEETAEQGGGLWSDASCERVYVARVCFESGKYLRYRFCRENSAFDLLSAEKRAGNEWIELR